MKTVFNRALSLVMCLILICSTVSVAAFGVSAEEGFNYKTYAQNATKENVHHLLDFVDDELEKANKGEQGNKNNLEIEVKLLSDMPAIVLGAVKLVLGAFVADDAIKVVDNKDLILFLDLSSIDAICKTLDNYRTVIELATNDTVNKYLNLGDLKEVNLDVFDEGMSRAKSGDVKIFTEVLELAAANREIIGLLLSGELKLGVIGDAAGIDFSGLKIDETVKKGIVNALFDEGDANYVAAKNRALTDFDSFVYTDVVGLVSNAGGILEGVTLNETTTIDDIITNVFNIVFNNYLVDFINGKSFKFAALGEDFAGIDTVIEFDGKYDFSKVVFSEEKTVLEQVNDVLGEFISEIAPSYSGWTAGDYKVLGNNINAFVRKIASVSNFIKDVENKSDETLIFEFLKFVLGILDDEGELSTFVKDTASLPEMADKLVVYLFGGTYVEGMTYEHALGDIVIENLQDIIPLYDASGKVITVNSKYTIWEVLNSALNFLLVDKNLNAYFGMNVRKADSFFDKFDEILDFTADDGESAFKSEEYINDLLNSIFTVDLQGIIELTAAKALNFAGNESLVTFLYKTVYNLLNNWVDSETELKYYSSKPFNNALSDAGIANLLKVAVETLSKRSEGTACFVGLIANFITDINEKVELKDATCTDTGYKTPHKTCLKCNKVYLQGTVAAAKGHSYDKGVITIAPKCTVDGEKTYTCTVCGDKNKVKVAKTGHKTAYKTIKAANYKEKGIQVNVCTVCNTELGRRYLNMLTLSKPTGLKAQALSTTSIKYSWKAVPGAESYTVYYKTNTGSWKSVTVKNKKTSVTIKKLKAGLTYKFKVVAVAGSNKSKESATVNSTTKPSKVTIKALRSKKKKEVVVEWKKLSGVTGYEIQSATDKKFKKNKKTVTIKKAGTVKTIIKKLKSKKTYYVRVRAYKTVNKVKVYGAYSKVKNIKCK